MNPELIKRAIALVKSGLSYEKTAEALSRDGKTIRAVEVRDVVSEHLYSQPRLSKQEEIELEVQRLDHLLSAIAPDVNRGDVRAVELALKISDRRGRLRGWDSPTKLPDIQVEPIENLNTQTQALIESLKGKHN